MPSCSSTFISINGQKPTIADHSTFDSHPANDQSIQRGGVGGGFGGFALTIWAIDDARAVGDDEDKTGNDEG